MPNPYVGLLAGLGGLGQFTEGSIARDKQDLANAHLEETKRQNLAHEAQANTPVDTLVQMGILPKDQFAPGSILPNRLADIATSKHMAAEEAKRVKDEETTQLNQAADIAQGAGIGTPEAGIPGNPLAAKISPYMRNKLLLPIASAMIKEHTAAPKDLTASQRVEERITRALAKEGWNDQMPGYDKAFLSVQKQVPVEGAAYGQGQFVVPPPPGTPGIVPDLAIPTPQREQPAPIIQGQRRSTTPELDQIATENAATSGAKNVIANWEKWPSTTQLLAYKELPGGLRTSKMFPGIGPTESQKTMLADAAQIIGQLRKALSGLAVTQEEAVRFQHMLPDNPAALEKAQLQAAVDFIERKRAELNKAFAMSNIKQVPGVPGAIPTPQGAPAVQARPRATKRFNPATGQLEVIQ